MKRVLVFGAGRVARPCVQYLLRQEGIAVTVVDLSGENLERVTENHPRSTALVGDAGRESAGLIASVKPDLVINLLPPAFMAPVARQCLEAGVHLVHPAYLDAETLGLDSQARAAGLTFLAELGLDPGIDHMSAARTVGHIRGSGERSSRSGPSAGRSPRRMPTRTPGGTSSPGPRRASSGPASGTPACCWTERSTSGRGARPTSTSILEETHRWAGSRFTPTRTPCLTWSATGSPRPIRSTGGRSGTSAGARPSWP